jgi:hypothetical protein
MNNSNNAVKKDFDKAPASSYEEIKAEKAAYQEAFVEQLKAKAESSIRNIKSVGLPLRPAEQYYHPKF